MPAVTGGFSVASRALGICDRCGLTYPLIELRNETVNRKLSAVKVCPECWDPDHPQNYIGLIRLDDPKPLREARPDPALENQRGFFGWKPVLGEAAFGMVGTVTVVTT